MMTASRLHDDYSPSTMERLGEFRSGLARAALPIVEILLRIGVAGVFWKAAMAKLANWDLTLALFTNEYAVPFVSPSLAASLATTVEAAAPVMLVFGIAARLGAAALLALTLVIQVFVYPDNWLEHLFWGSVLAYVLTRGPGVFSIDHAVARHVFGMSPR